MIDISNLFEETFFSPIIIMYFHFLQESLKIFMYKNDMVTRCQWNREKIL